jgi:long-chain acyl-CoA synthetase
MLDAPLVAAALPLSHLRRTQWAGAADIMFTNPLMRLVSRLARVLPIERYGSGTGVKNLALAIAALQQGRNLVWFPEGRISTTARMLPFREGVGIILERQPTPVVPVYIHGTRAAMPPEASLPRFKPVTITFGPPCDPGDLANQGQGETPASRLAQALQHRVAQLKEQPHIHQAAQTPRRNFGPLILLGLAAALVAGLAVGLLRYMRRK